MRVGLRVDEVMVRRARGEEIAGGLEDLRGRLELGRGGGEFEPVKKSETNIIGETNRDPTTYLTVE